MRVARVVLLSAGMKELRAYIADGTWPSGLVECEAAAQVIGLTAARLRELAMAEVAPHFRIDGGEPKFLLTHLKPWAAQHLLKAYDGEPIPVRLELVSAGDPVTEPPPMALRALKHLRQLPVTATVSGIYFLCHGEEIVYIGQSVNAFNRIGNGHRDKEFDRVYFLPVAESALNTVEAALIRHCRPALNGRSPRGTYYTNQRDTGADAAVILAYSEGEGARADG